MKKKILITILMITISVFIVKLNICYAASASEWINTVVDENVSNVEGKKDIANIIGIILGVVKVVATGIAAIMILYLAIKYMSAAPSEKANIKTQLITFALGAIFVYGASTIVQKAMEISQNTIK